MKKFLIGCLGVVVVLGIAAAFGGYYFVYKPAKAFVAEIAKYQEVPKLNAQVRNKQAFSPPSGNELTRAEVERFMRTQQSLQTQLGARVERLKTQYQVLGGDATGTQQKQPSFTEVFGALKDLGSLIVDAKRAQVEALNQSNYSLEEYEWTRDRVYEAAGIPIANEIKNAIRDAASGKKPEAREDTHPEPVVVPKKNRDLVMPFADRLREGAALAFFGL